MTSRQVWGPLAVCAVAGLACADSIVRILGPENDPQLVNTSERFQFSATDLRNVNDQLTWTWPNPAPQAAVDHSSFLHHGYGILIVLDALGTVVDSTLLEYNLDTETRAGTPGNWTLILVLAGARGRADFALTPLSAPAAVSQSGGRVDRRSVGPADTRR